MHTQSGCVYSLCFWHEWHQLFPACAHLLPCCQSIPSSSKDVAGIRARYLVGLGQSDATFALSGDRQCIQETRSLDLSSDQCCWCMSSATFSMYRLTGHFCMLLFPIPCIFQMAWEFYWKRCHDALK
eukprot:1154318-Pelagomonas_calceolata.AAC.10